MNIGVNPNLISAQASTSHYASMTDWAVDLGSGFGEDCDVAKSPTCNSEGAHILSIPRTSYISECCDATAPDSVAAMLVKGQAVRGVLADMVLGGLEAGPQGRLPRVWRRP